MRNRFSRRHSGEGVEVALANFSLTFAKALLVLSVVLFMLISPQQGKDGVKPNAEFLITIDWTVDGKYDVDSWTLLPDKNRVSFMNKESGIVFLERDDLGQDCNTVISGGKSLNDCEEITVLRGIVPGEYEFAIHLYSVNNDDTPHTFVKPVTVRIKIEKLNPESKIVWQTVATLDTIRQEKPIVRFTINTDGSISDISIDELPNIVYIQQNRNTSSTINR